MEKEEKRKREKIKLDGRERERGLIEKFEKSLNFTPYKKWQTVRTYMTFIVHSIV